MKKKKMFKNFFTKALIFTGMLLVVLIACRQVSGLNGFFSFTTKKIEQLSLNLAKHWQSQNVFAEPLDLCEIDLKQINLELIPERLIIKSVQIDVEVVSVPLENGTWKVHDNVANYAQGTSLINGRGGNVGIYGHDLPTSLRNIKKLKPGDEIIILSGEYLARYQAVEEMVVQPEQINVFYPSEQPTLTLATCEGIFSEKRFLYRAKLENIEKMTCELEAWQNE